jgi:hypothetical protein
LVWFYSYAVSGVAHADPLSSYRKRKTLWGIKTSPSAVLLSICYPRSPCFQLYQDRSSAQLLAGEEGAGG